MLRATILTIVLTVAAGQNAALHCWPSCHPAEGTAATCGHEDDAATSPGVIGTGDCHVVTLGAIAFIRDDGRRGDQRTDHSQTAVNIPRFAFALSVSDNRYGHDPGGERPLEARPRALALRI